MDHTTFVTLVTQNVDFTYDESSTPIFEKPTVTTYTSLSEFITEIINDKSGNSRSQELLDALAAAGFMHKDTMDGLSSLDYENEFVLSAAPGYVDCTRPFKLPNFASSVPPWMLTGASELTVWQKIGYKSLANVCPELHKTIDKAKKIVTKREREEEKRKQAAAEKRKINKLAKARALLEQEGEL